MIEGVNLITEDMVLKQWREGSSIEELIKRVRSLNKLSAFEAKRMVERTIYDYQMKEMQENEKRSARDLGKNSSQTTSNVCITSISQ